jgi:O-antigen/teichoic acid export membrane protein
MPSLARQAFVVSASRLANQALMVLSPLVLARLLSVEAFGHYREFLLYATLLGSAASFSLPNSLLYFIGRQPAAALGYARRVALATGWASVSTVLVYAALEALLPRPPLGELLLPCLLYVLCFANLDFWEYLWLARREPGRVAAYTAGRLAARTTLVCCVAWLTGSVAWMAWSMVALEALRLAASACAWRRLAAGARAVLPESSWREQLAFALPGGLVVLLSTLNRSLGGMVVGEARGAAELALLVVGGYVLGLVSPLRNAVSDVLLPKLAAQARQGAGTWVQAWQRSSVQVSMLLFPAAVLSWRHAETFLAVAFAPAYAAAAPLLRWHAVMIALACLDFALAMRVLGRTRRMLGVSAVTIGVNLALLPLLLPRMGAEGAAAALLASTAAGSAWLAWQVARATGTGLAGLLPLAGLARVGGAALLAGLATWPAAWAWLPPVAAACAATLAYLLAFALLLRLIGPAEYPEVAARLASWLAARRPTSA